MRKEYTTLASYRTINFLLVGFCFGLLAIAMVMQYTFTMDPCPLCVTQRFFVLLTGLIALAAALHKPQALGKKIYAGSGIACALAGAGVAGRHLWLQNLPADQVPTCGPGIGYLFETLPVWEALSVLFSGDGNCAEESWRFLGLTIPGWTLVSFGMLAGGFLWQFWRRIDDGNHKDGI